RLLVGGDGRRAARRAATGVALHRGLGRRERVVVLRACAQRLRPRHAPEPAHGRDCVGVSPGQAPRGAEDEEHDGIPLPLYIGNCRLKSPTMLDILMLRKDLASVVARLQTRKNPQPYLNVAAFEALEAERKA